MTNSMANADAILREVVSACDRQLSPEREEGLTRRIKGMFASVPVVGRTIVQLADSQDWEGLAGAIGGYIDMTLASGGGSAVRNTIYNDNSSKSVSKADAQSESLVHAEQQFIEQLQRTKAAIEYSDSLSHEDKVRTIAAVEDAKRAAEDGDHKTLAEKLGNALDIASKGAGVAKAVLELAPMIIGLLPSA